MAQDPGNDVAMEAVTAPDPAGLTPAATSLVPIVEIAHGKDMWWPVPAETSASILAYHNASQDAIYTWDWGDNGRDGSFKLNGEATKISRYRVDLRAGKQKNVDNLKEREVRVVWVEPADAGQMIGNVEGLVRRVEVLYDDGKWWTVPAKLSGDVMHARDNGLDGAFYKWGGATKRRRYAIDFGEMTQTNLYTGSERKVRVVWMQPAGAGNAV